MSKLTSQERARLNRRAAALEARRARTRRNRIIGVVVGVVVVALGIVVYAKTGGDSAKVATDVPTVSSGASDAATSAPTTAAAQSAKGKPCVAVADPLPAGAPDVPVQVGPPPSSLVTKDLKVGTGADVTAASTVTVNYIGVSCSTGKIFDSSYKTGQPATFPLSGVIPGWTQGLTGMKVGGSRLLGIPPDLGYGSAGQPPTIAPDETLWFVVDILDSK